MCQVNPGNSPVSFHITTDICLHRQLAPWSPQAVSCRLWVATPPWKASRGSALLFSAAPLGLVAPVVSVQRGV